MSMALASVIRTPVIPGAPQAREGDPGVRASLLGPLPLRGCAAPAGDDIEVRSAVSLFAILSVEESAR